MIRGNRKMRLSSFSYIRSLNFGLDLGVKFGLSVHEPVIYS